MSTRRITVATISLAAYTVAEIVLSIAAIGHRHTDQVPNHGSVVSSCSHGHVHSHAAPTQDEGATHSPSNPKEPPDSNCSICRHLGQVAIPVIWTSDPVSHDLVERVVHVTYFDVASPSHLLPQPRSPPAAI
jgi:hypothetical protein